MGSTPLQKFIAALRQLCYGFGVDMMDFYCRILETTALKSMKEFFSAFFHALGTEFLRRPTHEDLQRIQAGF